MEEKRTEWVKVPWLRFLGMGIFLLSLILANFVSTGKGPWGVDLSAFYVNWLSYLILVVTSFIFIYLSNKDEEGGNSK